MKNIILLVISFIILLAGALSIATYSSASVSNANITGYAWSSNIGWIKFNGSNYGVKINQQAGTLSGQAWSSNIGWISFDAGDLTGCPTNPCHAKLDGNSFSGWAKALVANGSDWDGWIHLAGTGYGLTLQSNNSITGYAWGGPVVGWITSYNLSTDFASSCEDGIDNDNDGQSDDNDVDCGTVPPPPGYTPPGTETVHNPVCNNGLDDDAQGDIDYPADPDCTSPTDESEDSGGTPEVTLRVGVGSPAFDAINLGKDGGVVKLRASVSHATTTTSCIEKIITGGNTTQSSLTTNGSASFDLDLAPLSVIANTKVVVSCSTDGRTGSDDVDILIKDEHEF